MSTTVELSLLALTAAAAGGFAFVDGDTAFTVIFMVMSGFALGHVFRVQVRIDPAVAQRLGIDVG
jgi:hypothetical protein